MVAVLFSWKISEEGFQETIKCNVMVNIYNDMHLINCFHSSGVITVAPGVGLNVGQSYALTVEAMDNGPAHHRR